MKVLMRFFLILMVLLLSSVAAGSSYPPPCNEQTWIDPNNYPFIIDVNNIVGYPLGYLAADVNGVVTWEINYCDPDGDPMVIDVNNLPVNGSLIGSELRWQPAPGQELTPFYIYITVTDIPGTDSLPASTTGTLILYAYRKNEPPVIDVCPSSAGE